jgi:hypothetical protein
VPIRTNRGRAAVYRRLWGWPMRSPRHLVATLLVFAAAVLFIGLIVPRLTGSDDNPDGGPVSNFGGSSSTLPGSGGTGGQQSGGGAQPGGQPGQPPSTSLPTRLTTQPPSTTSAPAPQEALDVANKWGQAWVNHPQGITNEQWLAGLRPYTTEERIAVMSTVDPANVPDSKLTGPPVTKANYVSSVTVTLPTDHGKLDLSIILTPQGWRVAEYDEQAA